MKIQGYSANQPLSSTEQVQNSNQQAGNTASTRQAATLQDDVVSLSGTHQESDVVVSPLVFGNGSGNMPPDPE